MKRKAPDFHYIIVRCIVDRLNYSERLLLTGNHYHQQSCVAIIISAMLFNNSLHNHCVIFVIAPPPLSLALCLCLTVCLSVSLTHTLSFHLLLVRFIRSPLFMVWCEMVQNNRSLSVCLSVYFIACIPLCFFCLFISCLSFCMLV